MYYTFYIEVHCYQFRTISHIRENVFVARVIQTYRLIMLYSIQYS